jgi:hypothetical protein
VSKATPAALRDRSVDYTDLGPRVTGWTPIGSGRKQLAPEPEPERAAAPAAPAPAPTERPLFGRGAKRNATRAPSSSEATKSSPTAAAPSKKCKSDTISTVAAADSPPVAADSSPALKRVRTASPPPSPLLASERAAADEPAGAGESLVGEGVQKRKRRPGRPKKSAARVVESGSE